MVSAGASRMKEGDKKRKNRENWALKIKLMREISVLLVHPPYPLSFIRSGHLSLT